jgi:hypothetical protein
MAAGGWFGADEIIHFDGGLFDDAACLSSTARASTSWSRQPPRLVQHRTLHPRHPLRAQPRPRQARPAGRPLHQQGRHPPHRRAGAHGPSPPPLGWRSRPKARELAQKRDAAQGGHRTRYRNQLARSSGLRRRTGERTRPWTRLRQRQLPLRGPAPAARPGERGHHPGRRPGRRPFLPQRLAGAALRHRNQPLRPRAGPITVWIGYIQWLSENGFGRPAEPILKPLDNIKHMDAILAYDADGNPIEPEWPADVIVG